MSENKLSAFIEIKTGFAAPQAAQLLWFLLLAALCMAISVFGYTAASAVFLAGAGPERIPLVYVLMGVFSLPVYSGFSQLIDRCNRLRLFALVLTLSAGAMAVLGCLAAMETAAVHYLIYMFYYMLWVLLVDIMFPSLVSDFFTITDLKRAAPLIAGAIAAGGMAGGGLALVCSRLMAGPALLVAPGVLCAGAVLLVLRIGRRARPLEAASDDHQQDGLAGTLRSTPAMLRRFPLILLLACSSCLFIVLNCIAEFQVFTIYTARFPEEETLAGFMGVVMALQSVLQFAVIYFVSGRMLKRLGIVRMNLVYPVTTLLSFVGLLVSFRPLAAVAAHMNYDALYQSIDKQAVSLNYNALPHRIVGRARVMGDGIFYFFGIALAGCFLLTAAPRLSQAAITICGLVLCLLFVAVRCLVGKGYLSALSVMLRSGFVGFDDLSDDVVQATLRYGDEVPNLLDDPQPETQLVGIELAARSRDPLRYAAAIERLLRAGSTEVRAAVTQNLAVFGSRLSAACRELLVDPDAGVRKDALIGLIRLGERLGENVIGPLLEDPDPAVRALASVYAFQADLFEDEILKLLRELPRPGTDDVVRGEIIRAARDLGDMLLLPLIAKAIEAAPAEITLEGLKTIAAIADTGDMLSAQIALEKISHAEPLVRAEALRLLALTRVYESLPQIASALHDGALPVRVAAAEALAAFGQEGVRLAMGVMTTGRWEAVDAALAAIGRSRVPGAEKVILDFMNPAYRLVADCLRWNAALEEQRCAPGPVLLALEDFARRIVGRTMQIFYAFGNQQAVQALRMGFSAADGRVQSGALEMLDSMRQRQFAVPVLPLLRSLKPGGGSALDAQAPVNPDAACRVLLSEMLHAPDRWIRIGALMSFEHAPGAVPPELLADGDQLVRSCAAFIAGNDKSVAKEDFFMNRLLFLKNIPLFQNLSFEDLLVLDGSLRKCEYLQGETIASAGSTQPVLYLVYKGVVTEARAGVPAARDYAAGRYLGELSLFDDAPSQATLSAKEDCVLLALGRDQFRGLTTQSPDILFEICRILAGRLRSAGERRGGVSSA